MTQLSRSTAPLLLSLFVALPVAAREGRPIEERVPAERGGTVSIANVAGSVTVEPWSRRQVEVTGTLGVGAERVELRSSGRNTDIEVVLPERNRGRVGRTHLIVKVPEASELDVAVVSADVELRADAPFEIATVSGDVRVRGTASRAEVASVSGDVRILLSREVEDVDIATVSGDVTFAAPLAENARVEVETVSGDVDLGLPRGLAADVRVQTFNGRMTNKLTDDRVHDRPGPGGRLAFSTGGGGRVRVQTFSGDVLLDPTDRFDWDAR